MVLVLEGEMQDRFYFNPFKDHWHIFVISNPCTCWSYCEMIYTWGFWLGAMPCLWSSSQNGCDPPL